MNKTILLKNRPEGKPSLDDFTVTEESTPKISEGEILLKSRYVSVDPFLRGRMRDEESYIPPFQLNEPLESMIFAEVVESRNNNFKEGEYVSGMLKWQQFQISKGNGINKVDPDQTHLSAYLGVLGLTGLTAYLGLETIADLKAGDTLVVSGAAGTVGSIVGQIGEIKGCMVVGIAGSDNKVRQIEEECGFVKGINYNSSGDMATKIREVCTVDSLPVVPRANKSHSLF